MASATEIILSGVVREISSVENLIGKKKVWMMRRLIIKDRRGYFYTIILAGDKINELPIKVGISIKVLCTLGSKLRRPTNNPLLLKTLLEPYIWIPNKKEYPSTYTNGKGRSNEDFIADNDIF